MSSKILVLGRFRLTGFLHNLNTSSSDFVQRIAALHFSRLNKEIWNRKHIVSCSSSYQYYKKTIKIILKHFKCQWLYSCFHPAFVTLSDSQVKCKDLANASPNNRISCQLKILIVATFFVWLKYRNFLASTTIWNCWIFCPGVSLTGKEIAWP